MNKRDFRKLHHAVIIEAVIKLLYPEATLSEALRRITFVPFDVSLRIGGHKEKPEGFIFREEIVYLYILTEKSLINIESTQRLKRANLSWLVQKLVREQFYLAIPGQMIETVLANCYWEMAVAVRYIVEDDSHFNLASRLEISPLYND